MSKYIYPQIQLELELHNDTKNIRENILLPISDDDYDSLMKKIAVEKIYIEEYYCDVELEFDYLKEKKLDNSTLPALASEIDSLNILAEKDEIEALIEYNLKIGSNVDIHTILNVIRNGKYHFYRGLHAIEVNEYFPDKERQTYFSTSKGILYFFD